MSRTVPKDSLVHDAIDYIDDSLLYLGNKIRESQAYRIRHEISHEELRKIMVKESTEFVNKTSGIYIDYAIKEYDKLKPGETAKIETNMYSRIVPQRIIDSFLSSDEPVVSESEKSGMCSPLISKAMAYVVGKYFEEHSDALVNYKEDDYYNAWFVELMKPEIDA